MAGKLKRLTKEQAEEAVRMYERGLSCGAVAECYGVSRQAMWDMLKRRTTMRAQLRYGKDNHFYRNGTEAPDHVHNLVEEAMERGVIVRQPCEKCGANGVMSDGRSEVQAHHDDYNKPIDVRWLCQKCHHEWHKHNTPIAWKEVETELASGIDVLSGGFPGRAKTSPPQAQRFACGPIEVLKAADELERMEAVVKERDRTIRIVGGLERPILSESDERCDGIVPRHMEVSPNGAQRCYHCDQWIFSYPCSYCGWESELSKAAEAARGEWGKDVPAKSADQLMRDAGVPNMLEGRTIELRAKRPGRGEWGKEGT